ncbi:hypothetical protein PanWU01x14_214050 [Parasponia andersonii]|uniref:LRR domain containing protein n=1 Tax=Parasponia andersonii TaxID=3476 RepID=A0A2P5BSH0_PARAD|nr:hypothetical protein PanWU01x14_214050 [Parasponia andersonii]
MLFMKLRILNIRANEINLSGPTPKVLQKFHGYGFKEPTDLNFKSSPAYSYVGSHLCGPPLTKNCSASGDNVNGKKHGIEMDLFYVSMALGHVF